LISKTSIGRDGAGAVVWQGAHADFLIRRGRSVVAWPRLESPIFDRRSEVSVAAK